MLNQTTPGIGHNGRPPMSPAEDFLHIRIGLERALSRVPQQSVASACRVTRQCIGHYIAGTREMTLPRACQIARATGFRLVLVPVEE